MSCVSENAALSPSDSRHKTVPIIISSTAPRHAIRNVGDTLDSQVDKVTSKVNATTLGTDKPLEVARKCSELRRGMATLHKAPTIKSTTTKTLKHLLSEAQKDQEDQKEED